jgi:hypothetical protein
MGLTNERAWYDKIARVGMATQGARDDFTTCMEYDRVRMPRTTGEHQDEVPAPSLTMSSKQPRALIDWFCSLHPTPLCPGTTRFQLVKMHVTCAVCCTTCNVVGGRIARIGFGKGQRNVTC